jgi:hypothetical protein
MGFGFSWIAILLGLVVLVGGFALIYWLLGDRSDER